MVENFPFVGKWTGEGSVHPHGRYEEELNIEVFGTPGGKQLFYMSKTWLPGKNYCDFPMHSEIGMVKVMQIAEDKANIEITLSHPFGMAEIEVGQYENNSMTTETISISRTPSSSNNIVQRVRRHYWLDNGKLKYNIYLTINDSEHLHLEAELFKAN